MEVLNYLEFRNKTYQDHPRVQYATDKITKGRTSIVIAHRLATIKQADKIIVMDKGMIVEEGTHKELLKKKEGYYKNLYDKQFSLELAS